MAGRGRGFAARPGAFCRDGPFRARRKTGQLRAARWESAASCPAISSPTGQSDPISRIAALDDGTGDPALYSMRWARPGRPPGSSAALFATPLLAKRRPAKRSPISTSPPRPSRGRHRAARRGRDQGRADRPRARHRHGSAGNPPRHYEITTLRRDVETYGRPRKCRVRRGLDRRRGAARLHDKRAYISIPTAPCTTRWAASPICGAHRVRFVGDPASRIAEDVLRVLRYYRFEARFGAGTGDPPARAACRATAPLLPKLSAERVAQELTSCWRPPTPSGRCG